MHENTFWFRIWVSLTAIAAVTIIMICILSFNHNENMAKLGYEEVTIVGFAHPVWRKGE